MAEYNRFLESKIAKSQIAIGEQPFFQMFIIALIIAAGLIVGNTIFRSEVTL
jgi:hypothetical protein